MKQESGMAEARQTFAALRTAAVCLVIGCMPGVDPASAYEASANACSALDRSSDRDGWKLPSSAVDSDSLPDVRIDPDAPASMPLPVYRLSDNTYFLFGNISTLNENNRGFNANAGFIVTGRGVIVIDTLGTPKLGQRLISTIRCVTDQPIRYLVVTHNHPDHAYGASAFSDIKDITIIAHEGTIDYNHSETLESSVEYRRELLPDDMTGFKPLQADVYIDDKAFARKRIQLGDATVDIYNTGKHHSYGDLVVHQVNEGVVWISDLAFNQRTTYMGDGDSDQILAAQEWLLHKFTGVRLMAPGHGSVQSPPFAMVAATRDYVTRMREAMKQAVEEGTGMYDAVNDVEFDDWRDVPLYENNQRANANFVYREMERAYFDDF
jgi:glyoxylase-like metal-dependent hydrolase (beta-lactamase superfamily II)